jgi:Na+-driven multidrug efflux pump
MIEGYSWQLLILVSGYLSVVDQAANSIIMNIVVLAFSLNVAMMHSSCTLVGQQIGSGDVHLAKDFYSYHLKFAAVLMTFFSLLLSVFKFQLLSLYSAN